MAERNDETSYPTAKDLFWGKVDEDSLTDSVRLTERWRRVYDYYIKEAHRKAFSGGSFKYGPATFPTFEDWVDHSLRDFFRERLSKEELMGISSRIPTGTS